MRTEDGHIIYQCLEGEPSAFGLLVDKYKGSIFALAYSKLGNFHDAEDVTQEVFIKAYRKLKSLRYRDNFLAWMYAITSNLCKDWLRSRSRHVECELDENKGILAIDRLSMKSYQDDTLYDSLKDALDTLPEAYRQVLILHYLGGMSGKEIAKFLGTSQNAALLRLSRARSQLKEEMFEMMKTYDTHRLPFSFTFRIVEAIKGIKINSTPRIPWISWSASFTIGLIFVLLSLGSPQFGANNHSEFADQYSGITFAKSGSLFPISVINESGLLALAQAPNEKGQIVGSSEKQGSSGQDQKDHNDRAAQANAPSAGEVETVTVSGKVLKDDKPAKNVKINAYLYDTELKYEGITDADGTFKIKVAKPDDNLKWERVAVVAYQPGYSFNWKELSKDEISDITINLLKPAIISGTVTDNSDNPIQNIEVKISVFSFSETAPYNSWLAGESAPNYTSTTDANGRFTFNNLPEGVDVGIEINDRGYAKERKIRVSAGTEDIIFKLRSEGRVEGRVTFADTDKPAEGIVVFIQGIQPTMDYGQATTDENGNYTVTNLSSGQYDVMFSTSEIGDWTASAKEFVQVVEGETTKNADLKLIKSIAIAGKALEKDTDKPVSGVWVGMFDSARPQSQDMNHACYTDKEGSFDLKAAPGKAKFYINPPPGYESVSQTEMTIDIVEGQAIPEMNFYFQKVDTSTVKGSLFDIDGNPVPDTVISDASEWYSKLAVSDSDGKFTIPNQKNGKKLAIIAKQSDMKLKGRAEIEVQPDNEIEIVMQEYETTSVTGHIVDQNGKPIPSADINIIMRDAGTSAGMADRSGNYMINDLVVGDEYGVYAGASGYISNSTETFKATKEMKPLPDIVLRSVGKFYLEGFVKDIDGKPIVGASVIANRSPARSEMRTDENGYYKLENLANMIELEIAINHPDYGFSWFRYIPTNQKRDFVLERADGYLSGKVVDIDGNSVDGATVYIEARIPRDQNPSGHRNLSATTDANGNFSMDHLLVSKKVDVSISKDNYYKIFKDTEMNRDNVILTYEKEGYNGPPENPSPEEIKKSNEQNQQYENTNKRAKEIAGKSSPELDVGQWINGKSVDISKLKGKIIVLHFGSCFWEVDNENVDDKAYLEAIYFLSTLQKVFSDKGVVFVGIHGYTQRTDELKKLVKEWDPTYSMAIDKKSQLKWSKGSTFDKFGIFWNQVYVLIDRKGIVRTHTSWYEIENKIQEIISDQSR